MELHVLGNKMEVELTQKLESAPSSTNGIDSTNGTDSVHGIVSKFESAHSKIEWELKLESHCFKK